MGLILKIIGIIAIVVVVVVVLGAWWILRWFKSAIKADAETNPPCRVGLEPEPNPLWRSERKVLDYAGQFRAARFKDIGAFTIPEMNNLQVFAFLHPDNFYGIIYDHHKIDPTFEVNADFENDGIGLAGTNTTLGETLEQRPGHVTIRKDGASVAEILGLVRNHLAAAQRRPITAEGFVENFKQGYARSMNWTMKKGGITREEIRRQAAKDGQEVTNEQVEAVYTEMREGYMRRLREGCIAQYLDEQKMVAAEWERVQDRAFAIPEPLDVKEVIEAIETVMSLDEEQRHTLEKLTTSFGETAVNVAQRILSENIGGLGLQKLGEVKEPVPAVILLAPDPTALPYKLAA
jgi:hypothetical protein